jgi:hypothetical protein
VRTVEDDLAGRRRFASHALGAAHPKTCEIISRLPALSTGC